MINNKEKEKMIKSVKNYLTNFIKTEKDKENVRIILNAIEYIDRKFYIKEYSYVDSAIPIGYNQTISQPSTVARMLMLLDLNKKDNVLEIGTGSGWNASLMAYIVYPGKVLSLDIIYELILQAKENVMNLQKNTNHGIKSCLDHIEFKKINILTQINSWTEKYNKIIFTAGIKESQKELIYNIANKLLKDNGKLIFPYTQGPIIILEKKNNIIKEKSTNENYVFVPLLK
ncbi:MAG: methyltransferase domain-containing protein [Nanoarchaeota archaeon]